MFLSLQEIARLIVAVFHSFSQEKATFCLKFKGVKQTALILVKSPVLGRNSRKIILSSIYKNDKFFVDACLLSRCVV